MYIFFQIWYSHSSNNSVRFFFVYLIKKLFFSARFTTTFFDNTFNFCPVFELWYFRYFHLKLSMWSDHNYKTGKVFFIKAVNIYLLDFSRVVNIYLKLLRRGSILISLYFETLIHSTSSLSVSTCQSFRLPGKQWLTHALDFNLMRFLFNRKISISELICWDLLHIFRGFGIIWS